MNSNDSCGKNLLKQIIHVDAFVDEFTHSEFNWNKFIQLVWNLIEIILRVEIIMIN